MHWTYLKAVLWKFRLEGNISTAILALCSSPSSRVWTLGMVSRIFHISNGKRQGCPLSTLIFALMEPLAEVIRNNPLITGLQISRVAHKIGLYADNVVICMTNPERYLPPWSASIIWADFTYKMNYSKSTMLGILLDNSVIKSPSCSPPSHGSQLQLLCT